MLDVLLFAEDDALERFVGTLIRRVWLVNGESRWIFASAVPAADYGRVLIELEKFSRDCLHDRESVPDLIVVAVDANCTGINDRRHQLEERAGQVLLDRLVPAIADPHIERWFLLDGEAFRAVLGRGCEAPDQKCEKGRYKQLLVNAIRDTGVEPLLGGIEYAEGLAGGMDLRRASAADPAFRRYVRSLRTELNRIAE